MNSSLFFIKKSETNSPSVRKWQKYYNLMEQVWLLIYDSENQNVNKMTEKLLMTL